MVSKKKRNNAENADGEKKAKRARVNKNLSSESQTSPQSPSSSQSQPPLQTMKKTRSKLDLVSTQNVDTNTISSPIPNKRKRNKKNTETETSKPDTSTEITAQKKKNQSAENSDNSSQSSTKKRTKTTKSKVAQNTIQESLPQQTVQLEGVDVCQNNEQDNSQPMEKEKNIECSDTIPKPEIDEDFVESLEKTIEQNTILIKQETLENDIENSEENLDDLRVLIKEEIDLGTMNNGTDNDADAHANYNLESWSQADLNELLSRMESSAPKIDNVRHQIRADRLNWDTIAFGTHSSHQCKAAWESISKKIRHFRILSEMIDDAKQQISKQWTNFYRVCNPNSEIPRKPLTTYMLFYVSVKDTVLQENPGMDLKSLSKHISNMYRNLSPEKKDEISNCAFQLRKEYDCKMEEFQRNHPEFMPPTELRKRVPKLNPQIPKPNTPFKYYCDSQLEKYSNDPTFDRYSFTERCKEEWKALDDRQKVQWIDVTLELEKKYAEQLKQVAENSEEPSQISFKSILNKEEKMIKERMAGKPEKPPTSAYSLYSRLMMSSEKLRATLPKERMVVIGQCWKKCPVEERDVYREQVVQMNEQYKIDYAAYLDSLSEEQRNEEIKSKTGAIKKKNVKANVKGEGESEKEKTSSKKQQNDLFVYPRCAVLFPGEPEQPPTTPFMLFAKKIIANKKAISRAELENKWQLLSPLEKTKYQTKLMEIKKKFIKDYEEFLKGLEPDQLREYSNLKATKKTTQEASSHSSSSSDCDSGSECNRDSCSAGSDCSCDSATTLNS